MPETLALYTDGMFFLHVWLYVNSSGLSAYYHVDNEMREYWKRGKHKTNQISL